MTKPKLPEKITLDDLTYIVGEQSVATISTRSQSVRLPTQDSFNIVINHLSIKINAIITYLEEKNK